MIRLDLSGEPRWYDLGLDGLRLKLRPITTAIIRAASAAVGAGEFPEAEVLAVRMAAFNKEVARRAVIDWEGVADETGEPAPVSAEGIAAIMDLHQVDAAFLAVCLAPWFRLAHEKKDSAPSPDGSSERAPTIAPTAPGSAPTVQAS